MTSGDPASARTGSHHILQVAYYGSLLTTRQAMLEHSGYQVTSVLGNEKALRLTADQMSSFDLIVVGFSAKQGERASAVRVFKQRNPGIPVVVLQANSSERFPEADAVTVSEDPAIWLAAVGGCLRAH
jgi:DNA-binding NtrC family response regulator